MRYLDRLKQKWGIESNVQLAIVFTVFAITGSGSLKLAQPILDYFGVSSIQNPWVRIPVRILMILPVYQVLLLVVGTIFGQFRFFFNLQKRWMRFGNRKKSADDF